MSDLYERLKKATGPDRILDRDIARFVNGKPHGWLHPCMSAWGKGVPHYTRSFEAALELLPSYIWIEISGSTDTLQPGVWPAVSLRWLRPGEENPKRWLGTVRGAPSFALAMCRAAIEVRDRMAAEVA